MCCAGNWWASPRARPVYPPPPPTHPLTPRPHPGSHQFVAVPRIHDILVWIRIWIRGSMPRTNGSGSCYFRHLPSRCQQETKKKKFFCLLLFVGRVVHLHHFSKTKSQKEVIKQKESRFLTILLGERRIRIRILTSD